MSPAPCVDSAPVACRRVRWGTVLVQLLLVVLVGQLLGQLRPADVVPGLPLRALVDGALIAIATQTAAAVPVWLLRAGSL